MATRGKIEKEVALFEMFSARLSLRKSEKVIQKEKERERDKRTGEGMKKVLKTKIERCFRRKTSCR